MPIPELLNSPEEFHHGLWTQEDAIELCKRIESFCPDFGCHVALTGGCLYKEGPRKDLDILFYRIRQVPEINYVGLLDALELKLAMNIRDDPGSDFCTKTQIGERRIDMFFPEAEAGEYAGIAPAPERVLRAVPPHLPAVPGDFEYYGNGPLPFLNHSGNHRNDVAHYSENWDLDVDGSAGTWEITNWAGGLRGTVYHYALRIGSEIHARNFELPWPPPEPVVPSVPPGDQAPRLSNFPPLPGHLEPLPPDCDYYGYAQLVVRAHPHQYQDVYMWSVSEGLTPRWIAGWREDSPAQHYAIRRGTELHEANFDAPF